MKYLVLVSGGIDSATLLYDLKRGATCAAVTFDYGQIARKELIAAGAICEAAGVMQYHFTCDLKKFRSSLLDDSEKSVVVPARNLIFLSMAAGLAASYDFSHIAFGAHAGDHEVFVDCRESFFKAVNSVLTSAMASSARVITPYLNKSKAEIIDLARSLNVPLDLTWSCYRDDRHPCGECLSCLERKSVGL